LKFSVLVISFNPLRTNGRYHKAERSKILRSGHEVHLCALNGSLNKERLHPCTALTNWLFYSREGECLQRGAS